MLRPPRTPPDYAGFVGRTMASMMGATLEGMRSGVERDLVH